MEYIRDAVEEVRSRPLYALRCWLLSPLLEEILLESVQLEP